MSTHLSNSPHVMKEDYTIPGPEGGALVPIRIYRPTRAATPLPALVWIHGGGMVVGTVAKDDFHSH